MRAVHPLDTSFGLREPEITGSYPHQSSRGTPGGSYKFIKSTCRSIKGTARRPPSRPSLARRSACFQSLVKAAVHLHQLFTVVPESRRRRCFCRFPAGLRNDSFDGAVPRGSPRSLFAGLDRHLRLSSEPTGQQTEGGGSGAGLLIHVSFAPPHDCAALDERTHPRLQAACVRMNLAAFPDHNHSGLA